MLQIHQILDVVAAKWRYLLVYDESSVFQRHEYTRPERLCFTAT